MWGFKYLLDICSTHWSYHSSTYNSACTLWFRPLLLSYAAIVTKTNRCYSLTNTSIYSKEKESKRTGVKKFSKFNCMLLSIFLFIFVLFIWSEIKMIYILACRNLSRSTSSERMTGSIHQSKLNFFLNNAQIAWL